MLSSLGLTNLRCFSRLDLALRPPEPERSGWTILVGQNGVGKTTVLQSIVLAALDPRPATSLVPDAWTLVRSNGDAPNEAEIRLTTSSGARASRHISGEREAYVEGDTSRLDLPLVLAFSARRRIAHPGELPTTDNPQLERVRGLFRTDHPLLTQDAFAAFESKKAARDFAKVVRDVITHHLPNDPEARLFPLVDGLELRGAGGISESRRLMEQRRFVLRYGDAYTVKVGIEDLSDGYQAMFAIVLEILTQAAVATGAVPHPNRVEAVILIDEIEAHLHPRWQRDVVPLLREIFPRCQFVVTTHSPLVVGSAEAGEIVVLDIADDGAVTAEILEERLAMKGADRIYEEVFGVARTAPPDLVRAEREYLKQIATGERAADKDLANLVESAWSDAARPVR
jgi:predicted ATP-dependent endonuclease of OLD family